MRRFPLLAAVPLLAVSLASFAADGDDAVAALKAVGREGKGNVQASKAWRRVVEQGPAALVPLLNGLDGADAISANWLRAAFDAVAERELNAGRKLPVDTLEKFVRNRQHGGQGRRLAYEWLTRIDPKTPDRLLPEMLDDPGAELRRDAVARVVGEANKSLKDGNKDAAKATLQKALAAARDVDQVDELAKQLKGLDVKVDTAAHFGFVTQWKLVGPFDNTDFAGFAKVYPPEQGVDLKASYKGKKDEAIRWIDHATTDPKGLVDLNKAIGKHMGAVGYAYCVVESPTARPVELRVGCINAVKIFLNGKELLAHEEYHHGMKMDRYVGFGALKAGKNEILLKICQNEQKDEWAQNWTFQLRICDAIGTAVPVKVAMAPLANPTKEGKVQQ